MGRSVPDPSRHQDAAALHLRPTFLSTEQVRHRDRRAWLVEEIGQRYAKVEIDVPRGTQLFNEMRILPFGSHAMSIVRSSAIRLRRRADVEGFLETDAVFFILLLRGHYRLQQDGRSVDLRPGEITLYDVNRPHCVECTDRFSKVIFKAPGTAVRARLGNLERCTATRIATASGAGALAAGFLRSLPGNAGALTLAQAGDIGESALDLLALAVRGCAGDNALPRGRPRAALRTLRSVVEAHLGDHHLDAADIAARAGISVRYANVLLAAEGTSLMRYVWARRLERAQQTLSRSPETRIADLAAACGFKSSAHFSRAFRERFGCSPRAWRERPRTTD